MNTQTGRPAGSASSCSAIRARRLQPLAHVDRTAEHDRLTRGEDRVLGVLGHRVQAALAQPARDRITDLGGASMPSRGDHMDRAHGTANLASGPRPPATVSTTQFGYGVTTQTAQTPSATLSASMPRPRAPRRRARRAASPRRASGNTSTATRASIAPAANANETGSSDSTCSTSRKAIGAATGCGRLVATAAQNCWPARSRRPPSGSRRWSPRGRSGPRSRSR